MMKVSVSFLSEVNRLESVISDLERSSADYIHLDIMDGLFVPNINGDINQYERNVCPNDCSEHTNDRKISLEEWLEIVKLTNIYSQLFDKISSELTSKEIATIG